MWGGGVIDPGSEGAWMGGQSLQQADRRLTAAKEEVTFAHAHTHTQGLKLTVNDISTNTYCVCIKV